MHVIRTTPERASSLLPPWLVYVWLATVALALLGYGASVGYLFGGAWGAAVGVGSAALLLPGIRVLQRLVGLEFR